MSSKQVGLIRGCGTKAYRLDVTCHQLEAARRPVSQCVGNDQDEGRAAGRMARGTQQGIAPLGFPGYRHGRVRTPVHRLPDRR